jgi:hypothetical protein
MCSGSIRSVFPGARFKGTLKKCLELSQVLADCRMDDDGPTLARAFDPANPEAVPFQPAPDFGRAQFDVQMIAGAACHLICELEFRSRRS